VILATDIDPSPITAWLTLVLVGFGIIGGVTAAIALLWRTVALPQIETRVTLKIAEIDERIDAVEQANSASIARVHDRIDKVHIRIDGLRGPVA